MCDNKNYIFNYLKTYASNEWLADAKKRYRSVFDKNEAQLIGTELSIYNTKFNEEDWEAVVELRCIKEEPGPEKTVYVSHEDLLFCTDENVVQHFARWKPDSKNPLAKGRYKWSAYIDNELIGETTFYIEDTGIVTPIDNPYFELKDIKLFKGGKETPEFEDRFYLNQFNADDTKYVWIQLDIKNKIEDEWFVELFFNFQDDTGMLKEQISTFNLIQKDNANETFFVSAGWGQEKPGYWLDDCYFVNIVFMGCLIGRVKIQFGDEDIEGYVENLVGKDGIDSYYSSLKPDLTALDLPYGEDTEKQLNSLIGLEEIKVKIKEFGDYIDFIKLRKEQGFEEEEDFKLHSIFTGNPGTGKTTIVKLLGQIFKQKGLLSKGHVHEVDRSALIGEYIGQTAPMTKKAIDKARGGILFIDEAYMLHRDNERDYGKEVIEVLLKEMSDGPGDIAIMAAGYPDKMEDFLDLNPGLRSRFRYNYHFKDYTPNELFDIALFTANKKGVSFHADAQIRMKEILIESYRTRDNNFGNARYVNSLIEQAKMKMGLRALKIKKEELKKEDLSTILLEDIKKLEEKQPAKKAIIPTNELLLHEALSELNKMQGLKEVKEEVNELVKLVNFYRETGKDVMNKFSFHTVFIGNPGTGKTTVARIIGKIYKALGILEHGHVIETDREGLVEGYVAQTAPKTKAKIKEATDGILFIDEAYALARGNEKDNFGQEAIEVLLKNMEDMRGQFVVIVAGYPDNMYQFLESNHGLQSRFDTILNFKDYNADELYEIAINMFNTEKMYLDEPAKDYLQNYMKHLVKMRSQNFGNAREVRKLVAEVIRNQNLRLADLPKKKRTPKALQTIILDDVDDFVVEPVIKRPAIGFTTMKN